MITVRAYQVQDALALRQVFFRSIRVTALSHYTPAQAAVWAPEEFDADRWESYMGRLQPFVAEVDGQIAGYADINKVESAQYCHVIDHADTEWGYLDHFFVAPEFGRLGVGNALMNAIHERAKAMGLNLLQVHASLSAQGFFERWGFTVVLQEFVERAGQTLERHYMEKRLSG